MIWGYHYFWKHPHEWFIFMVNIPGKYTFSFPWIPKMGIGTLTSSLASLFFCGSAWTLGFWRLIWAGLIPWRIHGMGIFTKPFPIVHVAIFHLPKTNSQFAPENRPKPAPPQKEGNSTHHLNQPQWFRCNSLVSERVLDDSVGCPISSWQTQAFTTLGGMASVSTAFHFHV